MTTKQAYRVYQALQTVGRRRLPYDQALEIARTLARLEPIVERHKADLADAGDDAQKIAAAERAEVAVPLPRLGPVQGITAVELVPLIGTAMVED